MSDFIMGYAAKCSVSGNEVTFPAGQWDQGIARRFSTTSYYLSNTSLGTPASSQITTDNGEQPNGDYIVTVADASAWSTNDLISFSRQNTVNAYSTRGSCESAMSAADSMLVQYADATRKKLHAGGINGGALTSKGIDVIGMIPGVGFRSTDNARFYYIDTLANDIEVYNCRILGDSNNFDFVGTAGGEITVNRCHVIGTGQININIIGTQPLKFINNWVEGGAAQGLNSTGNPIALIAGNTFSGSGGYGMDLDARTNSTVINNLSVYAGTGDFRNTFNGVRSNNATSDGTAPGANSITNLDFEAADFFEDSYALYGYTPRSGSILEGAGIDNAALTEDFCGNLRASPPTIGAFEAGCPPVQLADSADVLDTAYNDRTPGTYPSAGEPAEPVLNSATAGDGQVVVDITPDSETDIVYIYYRPTSQSAWEPESESFKRTGSGTVTVTGLTNSAQYEFIGYTKAGGFYSLASNALTASPQDSTESVGVLIADAIVAALNGAGFSQAFTAERLFAPIFELKDIGTLHVTAAPRLSDTATASRSSDIIDEMVDVAIQQRVTNPEGAEVEDLKKLVDEIRLFLRGLDVSVDGAQWFKIENDPTYDPTTLRNEKQFMSIINTTYKYQRIK